MIIFIVVSCVVFLIIGMGVSFLLGYRQGVDDSTKHMLNLLLEQQKKKPKPFKERLNEEMSINKINLN